MIHNKNRYILILIIVFNCIVTAACYVMLTSLIGFNLNMNYPTLYDQIGFTLLFSVAGINRSYRQYFGFYLYRNKDIRKIVLI
ncbi:hypothetical protein [Erysipelothrix aquatica]|uniref:hypothetical protein n=1 Tax=Erysipelothrix aquatica TaxID=2683714 RepID=UPI00135C0ADB|nr:hypothetical protein [Erysipelothrix aquatica]